MRLLPKNILMGVLLIYLLTNLSGCYTVVFKDGGDSKLRNASWIIPEPGNPAPLINLADPPQRPARPIYKSHVEPADGRAEGTEIRNLNKENTKISVRDNYGERSSDRNMWKNQNNRKRGKDEI